MSRFMNTTKYLLRFKENASPDYITEYLTSDLRCACHHYNEKRTDKSVKCVRLYRVKTTETKTLIRRSK